MEQQSKKYTLITVIMTFIFAVMALGGSYILDPFQIYHASFYTNDKYLNNDRYQNIGLINRLLIEKNCCDTVIFGTSHTQNFLPDHVQETLKVKGVLDLAMSGAQASEKEILFDKVLESKRIKHVIWGIHTPYADDKIFTVNNKELISVSPDKYFPLFLYDNTYLNDIKYLASIDAYLNTIQLYKNGKPYNTLKSWYAQNIPSFGKGDALKKKHPDLIQKALPVLNINQKFPNIDDILLQKIKNHSEIEFIIFLPPYSKHYYATLTQEEFNNLMSMRLHLIETLSPYKNVQIYAFDNIFKSTYNLNRYKDIAHYDEQTSKAIIEHIAQEKGILTTHNVKSHIYKLTNNTNRYIVSNK